MITQKKQRGTKLLLAKVGETQCGKIIFFCYCM